jgi:hypothetical protein
MSLPKEAIGDDPRWHRFTPQFWQCAAYANPSMLPSISDIDFDSYKPFDSWHRDFIDAPAIFSSVLQLLIYGQGWHNLEGAVSAWASRNYPSLNPHLQIVNHVLGPNVELLRLWLTREKTSRNNPLTYGGYDNYHLMGHSEAPLGPHSPAKAHQVHICERDADGRLRVILETSDYRGWYSLLDEVVQEVNKEELLIDVYCKPVGWLGSYSRHTNVGTWYCDFQKLT